MKQPLIIVGAGGLGRDTAWLVDMINASTPEPTWELLGFVDDYVSNIPEAYPVLGTVDWLLGQQQRPSVVCAIGEPKMRCTLVGRLLDGGFRFATLIAPSAEKSPYATVGEGSMVYAKCILSTNVRIGNHVVLRPSCTVGHDTILDDFASAMPGVRIAGDVRIGHGVYMGIASTVINDVIIGNSTVIGAGAVVTNSIESGVVAVGVPAKPIRRC